MALAAIRAIRAALAALAVAVIAAHALHHLDWTTLPVIGPQGFRIGALHIFIH